MITITPDAAQQQIDRGFVMTTLDEIHTTWGETAWNNGQYSVAVRHFLAAAQYHAAATRDGR